KSINDSLGHQLGDRLLQEMARRIQGCLRDGDTVARLGGDEFVILLPNLHGGRDALLVASKILEALGRVFNLDGHELFASASIGISLYPTDTESVDGLLQAADTALYHAKDLGRNNVQFFTSHLNEVAQRRQL